VISLVDVFGNFKRSLGIQGQDWRARACGESRWTSMNAIWTMASHPDRRLESPGST
jgi:hypothetical protein